MRRHFISLPLCSAILLLAGCGPSLVEVKGVVKLDGAPVEGATVTFASEDGKQLYTGFTDAGGNFALSQSGTLGVLAGNYKVIVVKSPLDPKANMAIDSADFAKTMAKETKGKGSGVMIAGGPGKMMSPTGSGPAPIKSDLPVKYAAATTSQLTAKVPSDGPIVLDLTGDAKPKK